MNIAITGLNATDNPGPGVPLIRSIKAHPDFSGKIIGFIYDSLEPGIYMDDVADIKYLIPYPSSGLEILYERICAIHQKEKLDLIIPSLDSELYGFVKLKDRLEDLGIKTFLPTLEHLNIRAKDKLFDFCKTHGINAPKNILLTSPNDINNIPKDFEYPLVVKGIFYDAYIANNIEEVKTAFNKMTAKWGYPIIIQEFIKGAEFNVVGLGDGTGATIGAVPMKKLYITDKGKGWAGITIEDDKLLNLSKMIIEKSKWKSGLELEFIKSEKSNEYYLLEINPRFPAWVYLAPSAGQNLPYALLDLAFGKQVEPFNNYTVGTIFVRASWDLITDIKAFEKIAVLGEI
ncbi:MAG: ATP-grasp domain-containing protein [Ignavibacteriaceae bacterium]|nr:ATP-grasp domain-containing protein [Ignavibacteriaceae bacterium]